jgi:hypothetical protein
LVIDGSWRAIHVDEHTDAGGLTIEEKQVFQSIEIDIDTRHLTCIEPSCQGIGQLLSINGEWYVVLPGAELRKSDRHQAAQEKRKSVFHHMLKSTTDCDKRLPEHAHCLLALS